MQWTFKESYFLGRIEMIQQSSTVPIICQLNICKLLTQHMHKHIRQMKREQRKIIWALLKLRLKVKGSVKTEHTRYIRIGIISCVTLFSQPISGQLYPIRGSLGIVTVILSSESVVVGSLSLGTALWLVRFVAWRLAGWQPIAADWGVTQHCNCDVVQWVGGCERFEPGSSFLTCSVRNATWRLAG